MVDLAYLERVIYNLTFKQTQCRDDSLNQTNSEPNSVGDAMVVRENYISKIKLRRTSSLATSSLKPGS